MTVIQLIFFLCFSSPIVASHLCPNNQNGGILQTQHVIGWWGKCTKEYLYKEKKNKQGFFIINYYVLSPQDASDKITISYYDVATLPKDISLTRSNVLSIEKEYMYTMQTWLDKITRVIPVKFVKVKSLESIIPMLPSLSI